MVRRGEDTLTYLNKDQFYALTMEFTPTLACPKWNDEEEDEKDREGEEGRLATTVVMLQFRWGKNVSHQFERVFPSIIFAGERKLNFLLNLFIKKSFS